MKKLFLFMALPCFVMTYSQVGINTPNPQNALHIVSDGTKDPLRVDGLKSGSGSYLLVDSNGVIKTSTDRSNLTFVLPSVSSTSGLVLAKSSQTGSTTYAENSSPTGSISPGNGSWTKIPGLESTLNIIQSKNTLNIAAEGMVQYNSQTIGMASGTSVTYAIGIFVDSKLAAVRTFTLAGDGFWGTWDKWSILGQVSNLTTGSHKIEVYATRRNVTGGSEQDLAIATPAPSIVPPSLNQFMAKAILQINGVYQ